MLSNMKIEDQTNWLRGFGIFLTALFALAVLDVMAKDLVQRNSAPLVNLTRYIVVLAMALGVMLKNKIPFIVAAPQRRLLWIRGAMLGMVGICFMPALQYMPLAEATAIYFSAPLMIVALAPLMLKETVRFKQIAAVVVGMIGMLLIVHPSGQLSLLGSSLMLMAAISFAMVQLLTRKLSGQVTSEQQFLYAAVICTVMGTIVLLSFWPTRWPDAHDMIEMLLVGFLSGIGQYLLIRAFQYVPASVLAPFNYFHLLLAVIFSMLVFDHFPKSLAVIGMLLITLAGLSISLPTLISNFQRK